MPTRQHDLDKLAGALAGALPRLDPDGERLALALYRHLAASGPATAQEPAAATGLPAQAVAATLGRWPAVFTGHQGRITGFWGLATSELTPAHRFETGGQVLYAWCAWDTLFLPARLGQAARVTSACPVTAERIELTVTPDRISQASHPEAAVSFLEPGGRFDSGVITRFCHYVHFFATSQAGERWAAEHPGTFLLTLGDAYDLATRVNKRMFSRTLA